MFSRFFAKRDKAGDSPINEAKLARKLVVNEDKPAAPMAVSGPQHPPVRSAAPAAPLVARQDPPASQAAAMELDFVLPTAPMALEEMTPEQRKQMALEIVDLHHPRIANTIRTLWGYKECGVYINKLIMSGGDGMGHARVGFHQDAVEAMLVLSDLHDAEFGPPSSIGGGLGLSL